MENINGWLALAWPYILNTVFAIIILIVGWIVANWVQRNIRKKGDTSPQLDDTLTRLFAKVAKILVLAVVALAVLNQFGVQTASLVAVLGALGLAVGLAWQGVLADFAAGIMILVMRPFTVGDAVEVDGTTGKVEEVGLVVTKINTFNNVAITMPNSNVWGNNIINRSVNDIHRVDMVVGFGYDDDMDLALRTIKEILSESAYVLDDPAPQVEISELGGSSVNMVVRPWTERDNYWTLKFELTKRIKERFDEVGLNFPYPSQDIYFYNQDEADSEA
jgi:small conductance mechanosensitive channel